MIEATGSNKRDHLLQYIQMGKQFHSLMHGYSSYQIMHNYSVMIILCICTTTHTIFLAEPTDSET